MKKKELQELAEKIAKAEKIIQLNLDEAKVEEAKNLISILMENPAIGFEDIMDLDEAIQEIFAKEENSSI